MKVDDADDSETDDDDGDGGAELDFYAYTSKSKIDDPGVESRDMIVVDWISPFCDVNVLTNMCNM
jgi:hypothetical protein